MASKKRGAKAPVTTVKSSAPPGCLDEIHIDGLLVRAILGLNPDERVKRQDFLIDLTLYADLSRASRSDEIRDTVDYKWVKEGALKIAETSACRLVEHLAQRLADFCLSHPRVLRVRVRVDKPGALRFARNVGFAILREKAYH
ncbi:MAG: dihydroneopterin aldolase [Spirochaetes bacterium]|nr:dihydroneopterin aldolase [Spirochaetota bacterium]